MVTSALCHMPHVFSQPRGSAGSIGILSLCGISEHSSRKHQHWSPPGYHEGWEPLFNHGLGPLLAIYFYGSAAAKGAGPSAMRLVWC